MNRKNNKYTIQQRPSNTGSTFLGVALGAIIGAIGYKIYNTLSEPDIPRNQQVPRKLFVGSAFSGMTPEEEQYVYDHIENEFKCNLSLGVMSDPVIVECGHTFDREILQSVLNSQSACPYCRKTLSIPKGIPNISLRNAIYNQVAKLRADYKALKQ